MKRANSWSKEDEQFVRDNYGKVSLREMAKHLNRGEKAVKSRAGVLGIQKSRSWPEADIAILREKYPDVKSQVIADELRRNLSAVHRMAHKLRLKKSDAFNASEDCGRMTKENRIRRGLDHRFPKGHVPANKGTRRPGYAPGNMATTQFKKGSKPPNRREIGDERTVEGYVYVKVQDGHKNRNWRLKHWVVWEKANGRTVPDGHIVHFRDRDRTNFNEDNLELVSKDEWIKRHRVENLYPEPIAKSIRALAGFKRRLNSHAKKQDRRSA